MEKNVGQMGFWSEPGGSSEVLRISSSMVSLLGFHVAGGKKTFLCQHTEWRLSELLIEEQSTLFFHRQLPQDSGTPIPPYLLLNCFLISSKDGDHSGGFSFPWYLAVQRGAV